eukprot:scaffold241776_cov39-Tisochrysis_lutea.AAC.2
MAFRSCCCALALERVGGRIFCSCILDLLGQLTLYLIRMGEGTLPLPAPTAVGREPRVPPPRHLARPEASLAEGLRPSHTCPDPPRGLGQDRTPGSPVTH